MDLRGSAERFLALADTAERRSQKEEMVAEIASALALTDRYTTRLGLHQTQRIVDLSWAARQAGRQLGVGVSVSSRVVKSDDELEVYVESVPPPL